MSSRKELANAIRALSMDAVQIGAGDHRRRVAGQKQGAGGDILRLSKAPQRDFLLHLLSHLARPGLTAQLRQNDGG